MTDAGKGALEISTLGEGSYRVSVPSHEGVVSVILELGDAAAASSGRLKDDDQTARATIEYLLRHQDAGDLPPRIDIGDVLAAYSDATEQIAALLG